MNRRVHAIFFLAAALLLPACRASQQSGTTIPSGPVQAATTSTNMIPAGTNVVILTNENIESSQIGSTFDAIIARDITNQNGAVLVSRGAPAELVILSTDDGGAVSTPEVELGLRSLTIDGVRQDLRASTVTERGEEGLGANRRTAEIVGGGAALGTLIGAVTGGGEGAIIGAATGAAVGAAAQVYTRGDEVRVPAETTLSFRLEEPLQW